MRHYLFIWNEVDTEIIFFFLLRSDKYFNNCNTQHWMNLSVTMVDCSYFWVLTKKVFVVKMNERNIFVILVQSRKLMIFSYGTVECRCKYNWVVYDGIYCTWNLGSTYSATWKLLLKVWPFTWTPAFSFSLFGIFYISVTNTYDGKFHFFPFSLVQCMVVS